MADDELTIDELARETGMTARNIRAHQTRGLLPPPTVRGRTGFYGTDHVTRIELIRELQDEGFNLESVRRLLEDADGESDGLLRFTRAVREPFALETPEIVGVEELAEQFAPDAGPEILEQAVALGLLRPVGDGRFEQRSPRLGRAAAELSDLGVAPEAALRTAARLRAAAQDAAVAYVELFLAEIWEPFAAAGRPAEQWPDVQEALERLRPLASESLLAIFGLTMSDAIDVAFGRELGVDAPAVTPADRGAVAASDEQRRSRATGRRPRRRGSRRAPRDGG